MRAVRYTRFGPPEVLEQVEIDKPVPKDDEILVKIIATTVHRGDSRMRSFDVPLVAWIPARIFLGFRTPRKPYLGMEIAGDVEAIGKKVSEFAVGDKVFASTLHAGMGGYAEYKCFPETGIVAKMPNNITYGEAAGLPTGAPTALKLLRKGKIQSGEKVLIYGASGSVGSFAVQIAKHLGADLTGLCSTANLEMVKSLGADHVIDYTQVDISDQDERYDLIFDCVDAISKSAAKKSLAPKGRFVSVHDNAGKEDRADLVYLKELVEAGALITYVDRIYPLDQIVEAHRYVDTERKRGSVVINVVDIHQTPPKSIEP